MTSHLRASVVCSERRFFLRSGEATNKIVRYRALMGVGKDTRRAFDEASKARALFVEAKRNEDITDLDAWLAKQG